MSNYSKGIISIPEVTGNIVITVTTEGQAVNLFDSSTASYNARIRGTGEIQTGVNGILVTAPINIADISTLTISGITEVLHTGYNYYAYVWTYSDADATTLVSSKPYSTEPAYIMDVGSIKQAKPTGVYCRVVLVLKDNEAISATDTANLTIYGS